jgi:hypothetical protein
MTMHSLESLVWIVPVALLIIGSIFFAPWVGAYVLIRKAQRQRNKKTGDDK